MYKTSSELKTSPKTHGQAPSSSQEQGQKSTRLLKEKFPSSRSRAATQDLLHCSREEKVFGKVFSIFIQATESSNQLLEKYLVKLRVRQG